MIVVLTSLPVVLSAPLFYSLEAAPAYLKAVSAVNPLTYQAAWVRDQALGHAILAVGWMLVLLAVAVLLLRKAERVSRER
jgi:ABC-2 type transport system permease protein